MSVDNTQRFLTIIEKLVNIIELNSTIMPTSTPIPKKPNPYGALVEEKKIDCSEFFSDEINLECHKNIIGTNVLICSTQLPGNGGSATNAYNIHAILQELNINSVCVFLEDLNDSEKTQTIADFNHHNLSKIYIVSRNKKDDFNEIMMNEFKSTDGVPEIAYCKNYSSPSIIRGYLDNPDKTSIVYLVAGSKSYTEYLNQTDHDKTLPFYDHKKALENDMNSEQYKSLAIHGSELNSVISSDYINGNSVTCGESYILYSNSEELKNKYSGELYTSFITHKILNDKIKKENLLDFDKRTIDVLFVVSNTKRKVKNSTFCVDLFNDVRLQDMTKVIIGDYASQYEDSHKNIKSYEKATNLEVLQYMSIAKIVINVSYYEASPNTCIEALCLGCHILSSNNCGSMNEILDDCDIINLNNKDEWVKRISTIIKDNTHNQNTKKITILENLTKDILYKKMKIDKKTFSFESKFSILSVNYFFMNSIKNYMGALNSININPENSYIMIPDLRIGIDDKYKSQKIKFMKNITKLKNFNIITNTNALKLLKPGGVLFSDCENMAELPGRFRKICKTLDINHISTENPKNHTLYVYFKKQSLDKYKKNICNNRFIDLSSLIKPI